MKSANYLRNKGYTLVDHNFHSRFGEIDLVCEYKEFIVFVEVKARNENSIALPREFVDEQKQAKIIATAGVFFHNYYDELKTRFVVIELYMKNY